AADARTGLARCSPAQPVSPLSCARSYAHTPTSSREGLAPGGADRDLPHPVPLTVAGDPDAPGRPRCVRAAEQHAPVRAAVVQAPASDHRRRAADPYATCPRAQLQRPRQTSRPGAVAVV